LFNNISLLASTKLVENLDYEQKRKPLSTTFEHWSGSGLKPPGKLPTGKTT